MFNEHQQTVEQNPTIAGTSSMTATALPTRFAQTSGEIVPTITEPSTVSQMIYTPAQMFVSTGSCAVVTD
jgi:hypothetical protein